MGEPGELGDFVARTPPTTDPRTTEPLSTGCRVDGGGEGVALTLAAAELLLDRFTVRTLGGTFGVWTEGERRALELTLGLARGLKTDPDPEPVAEPDMGLEVEFEFEPWAMVRVVDTFDFTSL